MTDLHPGHDVPAFVSGREEATPAVMTARFGAPVELPWWVFALSTGPAVMVVLALLVSAPLWARGLAAASSLALVIAMARIAQRVDSRSMQSVWVSLALAVWFFCAVTWLAAVMAR